MSRGDSRGGLMVRIKQEEQGWRKQQFHLGNCSHKATGAGRNKANTVF